ncbi:isochorismatase family protein [Dactylosporangium siamense]|uniref:Hydrolase n=1 Tax=Dactylosporangium siamense TaxID=685454 RepID=A0A919PNI0_9ACTN|nr:isochorismatase family protein [Dactylosporangium siamense]GIG45378.1 hydrolase [Dactylosporangium siamense]
MTVTALDPTSALVIIDLQHAVVGAPTVPHTGQEVVGRAVELARAFREHGAAVVLVRVTAGSDPAPGRNELPARSGPLPDGWDAVVDDLAGHPDDITVTKRTWNAFHGTDLDLRLRRRGVTQVVLAGLTTSIGVESTARAAYDHGYHVTLVTDAMADLDLEAHHNSLRRIFPLLGQAGSTAEIVRLLAGASSR